MQVDDDGGGFDLLFSRGLLFALAFSAAVYALIFWDWSWTQGVAR